MVDLNAANRKSIREAEKRSRQIDLNRGEVVKSIMSTIPGREYIWAKLEAAHIFTTSYSADALAMAFAEGERNQGLQLLNDLMQWCPDLFIQAMREQNERRSSSRGSSRDTASERSSSEDFFGRDQERSIDDNDHDAGIDTRAFEDA